MMTTNPPVQSFRLGTIFRPDRLACHAQRVLFCLLFGLLALRPASAEETRTLILGVFPSMTAKQIVETYRPLANALEKSLQRRVEIYSAPSFKAFAERTREGEYDLLLTAPHLAWLARQDAGYRPLLKFTEPVRGLLVVKSSFVYRDVEVLRGRTIAYADPLALIVLALQAQLAEKDLKPEVDYQSIAAGTHINAVLQVFKGRAAAAMVGQHSFMQFPPQLRAQLHVLMETPPISSLTYLAHPSISDAEAHKIKTSLLQFAATQNGRAFLNKGHFGGFSTLGKNELNAFRPYALQAQKILQGPE